MTSPRRFSALLGAFFVLPLVLAACGGDSVPGNAVVKIGSDPIKTEQFDHWIRAAATSGQQQTGVTGNVQIPQPPEFTACIANKKKTAVKPAKGQPKPTDASYKAQCETEYTVLRDQVLQFLTTAAWIEGESADRGVKVSDADVKKALDKQRQQSFPKEKDYLAYLKSSGNSQEDLLYRTKIQELSEKLRDKVLEGTDKISDSQIANYYNKNKISFAIPEQRDLRIILTKTEAEAKKAKAALDSGQSFAAVARKYSIDKATKVDGGELTGVPKGQQEKSLDAATFKAPMNKITGPVKTPFGYYIFEVTKITPSKQQPLSKTKDSIKQLLVGQKQQTTLDTFVKDFQKKWKDRTLCRKGFQTENCSNPPKAKPSTPAPATTATPQQNAPPANGTATTPKK